MADTTGGTGSTGSQAVAQGPAAAAQRGWSGWDAGAADGAAKGSAASASAAVAQLPGGVSHSAAGSAAAQSQAFAAFMQLLLEFFAWRSHGPDEALAWPPDQQVRSILSIWLRIRYPPVHPAVAALSTGASPSSWCRECGL